MPLGKLHPPKAPLVPLGLLTDMPKEESVTGRARIGLLVWSPWLHPSGSVTSARLPTPYVRTNLDARDNAEPTMAPEFVLSRTPIQSPSSVCGAVGMGSHDPQGGGHHEWRQFTASPTHA